MNRWLEQVLPAPLSKIAPASADASFRHYFRVHTPQDNYIIMDAPPDKEDCQPFIHIAAALHELGLQVISFNMLFLYF